MEYPLLLTKTEEKQTMQTIEAEENEGLFFLT
jgi:hypothetical protein